MQIQKGQQWAKLHNGLDNGSGLIMSQTSKWANDRPGLTMSQTSKEADDGPRPTWAKNKKENEPT
jgi:hypothetical protein